MSCPFMKRESVRLIIKDAIASASTDQRAAAIPHAVIAAKTKCPRERAWHVVEWLNALGANPAEIGRIIFKRKGMRG